MKFVFVFHELFNRIECITLPSVFKSNRYVSEERFTWAF